MNKLKKFFHELVRTGAWIITPVALIAAITPSISQVKASDGQGVVFAFQSATISQTVNTPNISSGSTLLATVRAAEAQDWKASSDQLLVAVELYGSGGGLIYSHSTGQLTLTDDGTFNNYTVTINAADVGSGWSSVESVGILITGQDGEFWAGNYGTIIDSASLTLDGTELLTNTEFSSTTGWTSSLGWQTCSGNAGGLPCVGQSAVEINSPTTTVESTITTESTTTTTTIPAGPTSVPNAGFENNSFDGWNRGTQTGSLGPSITSGGTGVSIFSGSRTFTHGPRSAVGSPILSNGSPNPYYAPAVEAGSWTFGPSNGTYAALLQPAGQQTFAQAMAALGLSGSAETQLRGTLTTQAQASGFGSGNPTDAAWITRDVELTAGVTYTMNWNYVGTDYVPFNDGSVTSLVAVTTPSSPTITVNNSVGTYALLGFTNPGTGDYSTNSFGSTGWQMSTYEVSVSGTYRLGFAVFNLDDTSLSPALMIDNTAGTTERCVPAGSNCTSFGGVVSNNPTAPTVVPATTTTTIPPTTTTTVAPATSLVVTNLLDDGSNGSLRWAITQANAQSGGMYDAITFDIQGTITLTSDLPAITDGLSITGTGRNTTIIDGNNLYRHIYSSGSRTVTIQDLTLKQGKNVSWNGGTIYNSQGTFNITNVHITQSPGWAFYQHGGGVTTFNNCLFTFNNAGVTSDHGTTPSAKSNTDTDYTNRIYINNSQFTDNTYGIFVERFIRINNSVFEDNSMGAFIRGLNRQQVYNSQFINNGTALAFSSWIPTSWTPGADNQLVEGNNFNGNNLAINFNNYFNNGSTVFNGTSSNAWSTSRNNTFNNNTVIYQGQGYITDNNTVVTTTTTTTTTTIAPAPAPLEELVPPTQPVTTEEPAEEAVTETTIPENQDSDNVDDVIEEVIETTIPEDDSSAEIVLEEDSSSEQETEETNTNIEEILNQEITPEVLEDIVNIINSGDISEEQVQEVVNTILEEGIDEEAAATLAASAAVIQNITADQASEIFAALPVEDLTSEQKDQITAAVQDAPQEVREAFEEEINIYAEGFDNYVAVGSAIDVGARRTLIAATTAIATAAAVAATGGASGGSGGPSGGSGGGSGSSPTEGRSRREEEGEEAAGEIAGPDEHDDEELTRNSIFNYYLEEGTWKKRLSLVGLVKKFVNETAALAFTLAGSVIVFITLSGETRKTAMIATGVALAVHYVHVLLKNDEA